MELKNYIGQTHLIGKYGPIKKMIDNKHPQSIILYGNPGIGKTTLANIIADSLEISRFNLNAANLKLEALKEIVDSSRLNGKVVIIMDEVHRLDKRSQNFLLPFLENNRVYMIGTTTENPIFSVNAALRSRLLLFKLNPIEKNELIHGLYKINVDIKENKIFDQSIYTQIYYTTGGDVRMSINILKFLLSNYKINEVTTDLIKEVFETNMVYDKNESHHYDLLSAFQKSIRASDCDAALHYLARLLIAGDLVSLCRRLVIIAYEDVGLGNPNACMRTVSAVEAFNNTGMPEGRIILSHVVVDLCLSPKSTSTYQALDMALSDVKNISTFSMPKYLLYNQPDSEEYDRNVVANLNNLPKEIKDKSYFISQESSNYERALNQTHLNKKKMRKKYEK